MSQINAESEGAGPTGWARSASPRTLALLAGAAIAVLVLTGVGLWQLNPGDRETTTEAHVYYAFAERVASGAVPYRDVTIEYPPGAIPAFLVPVWLGGSTSGAEWDELALNEPARRYERTLALVLGALLAATIAATAVNLRLLRATTGHAAMALGILGASPLLLGALPLTRYDAWPVLLVSLALTASLAGRAGLGGIGLGLAATAKLYPLVLLPSTLVAAHRANGRPGVLRVALGAFVAGVAVVVPFLLLAPSGTAEAVRLQVSRGLQMESLGGSLLAAAWKVSLVLENRGVLGSALPIESCQRCDGLVAAQLTGTLAGLVGLASTLTVIVLLVTVARRAAQHGEVREMLVWGTATSLVVLVVVGKVLSSQFLLWLLPLVPLVAGRRGRLASALLVVATAMTNLWFPTLYRDYVNVLSPGATGFLLLRNAFLVGLLLVLLWPNRPTTAATTHAGNTGSA